LLILSFVFHPFFIDVNFTTHFSDNNTAIGRVCSLCAKTIFIITIIGTANNIPTGHHKVPQNINEISITKGDRLSLFHISLGSITFPIIICAQAISIKNITVIYIDSNCISEKRTGNATAIIDQILGI